MKFEKVLSVIFKICGIWDFIMAGLCFLFSILDGFQGIDVTITLVFALVGLGFWKLGNRLAKKCRETEQYVSLIGDSGAVDLCAVADATGKSYENVCQDVTKLMQKGYWKGARVDSEMKMLIQTDSWEKPAETEAPEASKEVKEDAGETVICPCCGAENHITGDAGVCEYCGAPLEMPKPIEETEASATGDAGNAGNAGNPGNEPAAQPVTAKAQPAQIILQREKQMSGSVCDFDVYLMNQYLGILKAGTTLTINVDVVGTLLITCKPRRDGFMSSIATASMSDSCFSVVVNEPGEIIKLKSSFNFSGEFVIQYADNLPHVPTYNL